ncbi:hypothetical protein [Halomarina rubra]|uniref:Tail terminator n=1 Tax=Halomarina rubra TaxID=2071873 RepID=A0ABD6B1K2_9EURY|nr:hypothetical protein [Halomarina rubra]
MTFDWTQWYDDGIDALVARIETAAIDWATDANGDPWVIFGQRRPPGIGTPRAEVVRYSPQLDEANTNRGYELYRIQVEILVVREGDPQAAQANRRQAIRDMAAVQTVLYGDDRTLGGTCEKLTFQSTDAVSLENSEGEAVSVGLIQLEIMRQARLRDAV